MKNSLHFTCGDDLSTWIEEKAEKERRSVASVIRLVLYRAKQDEESNHPPIGTSAQ